MLERLRGIERSRFWQARNAFFELKYRLGLSRDRAWAPFTLAEPHRTMLAAGDAYAQWTSANAARPADIERLRAASWRFRAHPIISILIPVTAQTQASGLARALASVRDQAYSQWEIVVAAAPPEDALVRTATATVFAGMRPACIVRATTTTDATTAERLAAACGAASGDFVAVLDPGDAFAPDALYELAAVLNDDPALDLAYGDEDVRPAGASSIVPFFKPHASPDTLRSRDVVGRGAIVRLQLVREIGGFRPEFGNAAEYDLMLRATELTQAIAHVERVLYHRDGVPAIGEAGANAVRESLVRTDEPGTVSHVEAPVPTYRVRYQLRERKFVSIVVPTRDHADDLERCLRSIFERSTYVDFEVLIVDNDTKDSRALDVIAAWAARDGRVRVLPMPIPFNYSKLNNAAIESASGDYIVLLNNDTEVLTPDWLEAMMEQAQRPAIGAVGASLIFPDRSVQHGGVILGIGGVAGHSHRYANPDSAGYFGALRAISNYAAVTAACLMVRREAYDRVGGLDETLTVAFNDVDFCLRLHELGLRNVWLPHVVLLHGESKSRGSDLGIAKTRRSIREETVMLERWGDIIARDPYYNVNLTRRSEDFAIRVDEATK
jgi:GT2 family glycosyltransferase